MIHDCRVLFRSSAHYPSISHADVAVLSNTQPTICPGDTIYYRPYLRNNLSISSMLPNIFFKAETKPILESYRILKTIEIVSALTTFIVERLYLFDAAGNAILFKSRRLYEYGRQESIIYTRGLETIMKPFLYPARVSGLTNPYNLLFDAAEQNWSYKKQTLEPSPFTEVARPHISTAVTTDVWNVEERMTDIGRVALHLENLPAEDTVEFSLIINQMRSLYASATETAFLDARSIADANGTTTNAIAKALCEKTLFDRSSCLPIVSDAPTSSLYTCAYVTKGVPETLYKISATDFKVKCSLTETGPRFPCVIESLTNRYAPFLKWDRDADINLIQHVIKVVWREWIVARLRFAQSATLTVGKTFNEEALLFVDFGTGRGNFCIYIDFVALSLATYGVCLVPEQAKVLGA